LPPTDLPEEDNQNVESDWHFLAMHLLVESLRHYWRDRHDFFVGGNMFVYFNVEQARNQDFRGPDFFFVGDVDRDRPRKYWVVWEEGKSPDVALELLSPRTEKEDRTTKKDVYERRLKIAEYFLYDPDSQKLEGWRLGNRRRYQPLAADERGWLWSEQLQLWLGTWQGTYLLRTDTFPRFFDADGNLVLIASEVERQRADAEKQRADAAESEVKRLRDLLDRSKTAPGQ
jgi:Uma2 family endonuclease